MTAELRVEAVSLYRALLKTARPLSQQQRQFVRQKARHEFKRNEHLTNPSHICFNLRVGEMHLETVAVQSHWLEAVYGDNPPSHQPRTLLMDEQYVPDSLHTKAKFKIGLPMWRKNTLYRTGKTDRPQS